MIIYLIHFMEPIGSLEKPHGQAQHYLGSTKRLGERLKTHRSGNGSAIMAAVSRSGIDWILARTWRGPRSLERQLKRWHNAPKLCPLCNPTQEKHLHRSAKKALMEFTNG